MSKYDKSDATSYAIGIFPTYELLLARPTAAKRILTHDKLVVSADVEKLFSLANKLSIPIECAPRRVQNICGNDNAYIVGEFDKWEASLAASSHVVLVNPADMGNLGNIMRTMLGFGLTDLAIIGTAADEFAPKTVRASMGAVFSLNIQHFATIEEYLARFSSHTPYALMTDGSNTLSHCVFLQPYSLIFGNESTGLPQTYHDICNSVRIVHSTRIDSLNLPTAVAITLFVATQKDS